MLRMFIIMLLCLFTILEAAQTRSYDGYTYDQTTFSDGWVSTVKPDWVEVTHNVSPVKILLHYPKEGTIISANSDAEHIAAAWDILVAPRYTAMSDYFVAASITTSSSGYLASATLFDPLSNSWNYVVFFRRGNSGWIEFVAPDKATFMQLIPVDINTINWSTDSAIYNYFDYSGANRFMIASADLLGEWTNDFAAMQDVYNVYTGAVTGTYTYEHQSMITFNTSTYTRYDLFVSGQLGNYTYITLNSANYFAVPNPWMIYFADEQINNNPITYKSYIYEAYFSCIKNARLLWIKKTDPQYPDAEYEYKAYGKSVNNTSTPKKMISPALLNYLLN